MHIPHAAGSSFQIRQRSREQTYPPTDLFQTKKFLNLSAAFYLVAAIPVKKKNWPSLNLALPIWLNCGVCER